MTPEMPLIDLIRKPRDEHFREKLRLCYFAYLGIPSKYR